MLVQHVAVVGHCAGPEWSVFRSALHKGGHAQSAAACPQGARRRRQVGRRSRLIGAAGAPRRHSGSGRPSWRRRRPLRRPRHAAGLRALTARVCPGGLVTSPAAFAAILDEFAEYLVLERGRSAHTRRAYLGDIGSLLDFLATPKRHPAPAAPAPPALAS